MTTARRRNDRLAMTYCTVLWVRRHSPAAMLPPSAAMHHGNVGERHWYVTGHDVKGQAKVTKWRGKLRPDRNGQCFSNWSDHCNTVCTRLIDTQEELWYCNDRLRLSSISVPSGCNCKSVSARPELNCVRLPLRQHSASRRGGLRSVTPRSYHAADCQAAAPVLSVLWLVHSAGMP